MDLVEKIENLAKECEFSDAMIRNNIDNFILLAQIVVKECAELMTAKSKEAQEQSTYMGKDVPTSVLVSEIRKRFDIK